MDADRGDLAELVFKKRNKDYDLSAPYTNEVEGRKVIIIKWRIWILSRLFTSCSRLNFIRHDQLQHRIEAIRILHPIKKVWCIAVGLKRFC